MRDLLDRFFAVAESISYSKLLLICFFIVSTVGCASLQNQEAIQTERMLAAAGFQMKFADTPEKMAHLQTLPQRQLAPQERDGTVYYVYADATSCQCVYVGTEQAYDRYQELAIKSQIAQNQLSAAEMNQTAAMNWGMWGPWGPWY